jgi:hypothetical protein
VVRRAFGCLCITLALAACDKKSPDAADLRGSGSVQRVTGNERITWQQAAASPAELSTLHYNIYVDNVATEMQDVTCGNAETSPGQFSCSARLPSMGPGTHVLQITTFVDGEQRHESVFSPAVTVNR